MPKGRNALPSTMKAAKQIFSPQPLTEVPPPPETLSADGKSLWEAICTELIHYKVIAVCDLWFIEKYCQYWSMLCRIEAYLDDLTAQGILFSTVNGVSRSNPVITQYNTALKNFASLSSYLGLNPKARGSIGVTGKQESNDPLDEFEQEFE